MLIHYFESFIRCDACLKFKLKCIMLIQEYDDPCFAGLLNIPSTENFKENTCYPSCTIRDINPFVCGQFSFSFFTLWKFQFHGVKMPYMDKEHTKKVNKKHWD